MFGLIKNNIKTKIGIVLPASYPASRVTHESVSVTADGVKTYEALLNALFALVDSAKLTRDTKLVTENVFLQLGAVPPSGILTFIGGSSMTNDGGLYMYALRLHASNSRFRQIYITSAGAVSNNNYGTNVPTAGTDITLYY